MIGVVLLSHGGLARSLLVTASEIVGPIDAVALEIQRDESLTAVERKIRSAVQAADKGKGVLILVDMFGGTASNVALAFLEDHPVEVVTGVNLPMILKLATALPSADDLSHLAQLLKYYGQRNVLVASEVLKDRERAQ